MKHKIIFLYPFLLFLYSIYSFSQTTPNLVLSSNPLFWKFQQQMWQLGYHQRTWSATIFILLILALFGGYGLILRRARDLQFDAKQLVIMFCLSLAALLPSYPALSADVFNYVFNAKMVVEYQSNPHLKVATDFPKDPWLKYMHNIHTPAPYGYGWTGFSLVPYLFGGGYLQAELLIFRLFMAGSLVACLWLLTKIQKLSLLELSLLAFNPLVLIEIVGNIHNDLVMMAMALGGYLLVDIGLKSQRRSKVIFGGLLFGFSILIKYASILLILGWLAWKLTRRLTLTKWSVLSQLGPLVTTRSQRFLPWYLTWSLVFIPLVKDKKWQTALVIASFASLTSYALFLYHGDYSQTLLLQRSGWLFGVPLIYLGGNWIYEKVNA